jgi:hypothetical protein
MFHSSLQPLRAGNATACFSKELMTNSRNQNAALRDGKDLGRMFLTERECGVARVFEPLVRITSKHNLWTML